jgi:hypothetical protein
MHMNIELSSQTSAQLSRAAAFVGLMPQEIAEKLVLGYLADFEKVNRLNAELLLGLDDIKAGRVHELDIDDFLSDVMPPKKAKPARARRAKA